MEGKMLFFSRLYMSLHTCLYLNHMEWDALTLFLLGDCQLLTKIEVFSVRHVTRCVLCPGKLLHLENSWPRISCLREVIETQAASSKRKAAHLCQVASRLSSTVCLSLAWLSVPSYSRCSVSTSWMERPLLATFCALAERAATELFSDSRAWQRSWWEDKGVQWRHNVEKRDLHFSVRPILTPVFPSVNHSGRKRMSARRFPARCGEDEEEVTSRRQKSKIKMETTPQIKSYCCISE